VETTVAIRHEKSQTNHYQQQTNIQLFTSRMPFLSPNSVKALKKKVSHSMDLLTPSSTGRFQLCLYLSLATKGFWLPREGVAKPQVSPLTPVPFHH